MFCRVAMSKTKLVFKKWFIFIKIIVQSVVHYSFVELKDAWE